MKKAILIIFITVIISANFLSAQKTETVYYEIGKSVLSEKAKTMLNKSCEKIDNVLLVQITLIGHTDGEGEPAYNVTLSENRTKAVKEYLLSKGIDKDKIIMEFYGGDNAVEENENGQTLSQNRRVEVIIENKEIVRSDIFEKFNKESQVFNISANKNSTITGAEGTIIKIPKKSFVKNNGEEIDGEIEIKLKEFYKKSDILSADLPTLSDNKILETGGIIYISANSSGEELKLKEKEEIEIEFAFRKKNNTMETFTGERHHNHINWTQHLWVLKRKESPTDDCIGQEITYTGHDVSSDAAKTDRMVLKSFELGWINCGGVLKFENKTDLTVQIDTVYEPVVNLVFKDINAIMPGTYEKGGKIKFNNIPLGQTASLVAFCILNEEPYFISKEIVISKNQKENLDLIKTTITELKEELQKLN